MYDALRRNLLAWKQQLHPLGIQTDLLRSQVLLLL